MWCCRHRQCFDLWCTRQHAVVLVSTSTAENLSQSSIMGRIARHVHRMAVVCVRKCGALSSYMQELAKKQNVMFPGYGRRALCRVLGALPSVETRALGKEAVCRVPHSAKPALGKGRLCRASNTRQTSYLLSVRHSAKNNPRQNTSADAGGPSVILYRVLTCGDVWVLGIVHHNLLENF